MSAALFPPTLKEARHQARTEGRTIETEVLLADDTVARVKIGPRGGWKKVGKNPIITLAPVGTNP